jgi:hypothetical protein
VDSYGRNPAIAGFSDLDMVLELPSDLDERYSNHQGNGPSALLQAAGPMYQFSAVVPENRGRFSAATCCHVAHNHTARSGIDRHQPSKSTCKRSPLFRIEWVFDTALLGIWCFLIATIDRV